MLTDGLQEIDSTVGIMRDNINKVSERGARLDSLQDKTDNLAVSAQGFRRGANRVRKQMWWKDMKMRMCLIVGIIILLVIIIVPSGECWSAASFGGRFANRHRSRRHSEEINECYAYAKTRLSSMACVHDRRTSGEIPLSPECNSYVSGEYGATGFF